MISKSDKNRLIILAVFLTMILITVFAYFFTRHIPFKWIVAVFCIATVACWGVIAKKYLSIYGYDYGILAWIPIVNCLNIFSPGVAICLICFIVLAVLCVVLQFLPADLLLSVLGEQHAMWFFDRASFISVVALFVVFIVIGAGFFGVYRDVRRMYTEATGLTRPKMECVNYVLLFIPLFAVLGYSSVIGLLNQLKAFGYKEGEQTKDDLELNEVKRDGAETKNN